jgi:tetratricopeptide (TPR) repeat protein/mono/diheme cytochrome c family protein
MRLFSFSAILLAIVSDCGAAPTSARTPAYYRDIAPIIYQNCSTCHRPGESGPFSLLSYEDVKRHATQIATVTRTRFMPPWLPDAGHGDFQEERRLSEKQIAMIQAWAKAGAPAGLPADSPPAPKFASEWALGEPDLVLHVAKPYHLAPDGGEIFWNFVIPVPITVTKWVRAIDVRPGNAKVFHHANVVIDRGGSALRKETSPGAGFEGMDLAVEEDTFDPDGHFLSWKPGSEPLEEPDGMAWRAEPGMDLILNVHLRPSGKEEVIDPVIGLYFTDKPQAKFPMLLQLEHDAAIDIAPGNKDFVVEDSFRLPLDSNVLAVYPHAHYLATLMEAKATLPDGTQKWLIRIPHWDLSWQAVYRLKTPLLLPKGTVVTMKYHYDNSTANPRNPNRPPKEVKGGNHATDEMSHFWLQVLPVGDTDQRAVLQEALMHHRLDKYPGDFSANFNLGDLMMNENNPAAALPYFRIAAEAAPDSALAAGELGAALFATGDVYDAEKQYKRALDLDPKYIDARYNLASIEATNQQWPEAVADFDKILKLNPDHKMARQHLGEVYFLWADQLHEAGDRDQAVKHYQEAQEQFQAVLKIDPNSQDAKDALSEIQKPDRLGSSH